MRRDWDELPVYHPNAAVHEQDAKPAATRKMRIRIAAAGPVS